ncbi:MAG: UDP-N-acetylmuramoyl-tripeptide--D-alanyl-D-alanine ligase [Actinomyces sp.]|nr:UDP-N-acetylmuramoyl-tripeptide--D-alanyl-D-alanine ligase [Actinomyces sp.]
MQASAQWIAEAVSGRLVGNDVPVTGPVVTDSREAQAGSLYVARRGESADGHAFVSGAVERGAVAVIVEHEVDEVDEAVAQIVVEDSTEALGALARAHVTKLRSSGDLDVIAMTGSVGKTTTKDLLLQIMSEDGPTVAPKLSFNNEVGLPLTVLLADESTRHLVLEMGASGPGHITYLTDIVAPDVAIELCVGHAHVGGFGGFEGVAAAKAELIKGTRPGGPVILNTDDPNVEAMAPLATGRVIRFSASGNERADVLARDVRLDRADRASFTLVTPEGEAPIDLKIVGRHHVANALAAAAGALTLGVSLEIVASVLSCARALSPHRMDVHELRVDGTDLTLIDDSYNANLDSMRAGIAALASIGRDSQRIAVLGEMLELGEDSQSLHQQVGALIADAGVDTLIGLGADAHYYLEGAPDVLNREVAADPQDAARLALEHAKDGAVVLVKGSFGSQSWQVADILREKGTTR